MPIWRAHLRARVLHILCDLSGGGAERLVLELASRHRSDFDVRVATVQGGGRLQPLFEAHDIPLILGGRKMGVRWDRRTQSLLKEACADADIVHTHLFAGHWWGRLAARKQPDVRVISTMHNIDRDERWRHRKLRRLSSQWADHTVCVSDAVKSHCLNNRWADAARTSVIENGVDLGRFTSDRPLAPRASRLLAIGRLVPQKGFDTLIQACQGLDVTLKIIGEGPEREKLEAMAPSNVSLPGETEEIAQHFSEADVFIVPSRWEGFGLVAAEAMASGVPVIATKVDGLTEVLGTTCASVPPDDVTALRIAILDLLSDENERQRRKRAGLERVSERFNIERTVEAYAARYRSLLDNDTP